MYFFFVVTRHMQGVPHNPEAIYRQATTVLCVVNNSFPGSSVDAAATCCHSGFYVNLDTLYIVLEERLEKCENRI